MSVRDLEVRLTRLEDNILSNLGYREYEVVIGDLVVDPKPEVNQKSLAAYSETKLANFINALGGQGNPISFFELQVSRLVDEETVRSYQYWKLTRDSIVAECLPVSITVEDARYKVILAAIKYTSVPLAAAATFDTNSITWDTLMATWDVT